MSTTQSYPPAPVADVVDDYHGTQVADPYRPLEDTDAPETTAWITAQNARTEQWLSSVGPRGEIRTRLTELLDHPRVGLPWRKGDRWFAMRNTGLQDQDVLYCMDAPDGQGQVLLDPNTLSDDGTVTLADVAVTDEGRLLAYALSEAGSDWKTWRVRDIDTGEDTDDVLEWSKFAGAAWLPDGSGFLYGAYDPPESGEEFEQTNQGHQLRFHRLGTRQADDVVVHATAEHPERMFHPSVTDDGRYLIVHVAQGTDRRNGVWVADLVGAVPGEEFALVPLLDAFDAAYSVIGSDDDRFFVLTDHEAPRGRVVAIDASQPGSSAWTEIITEGPDTIEFAQVVGKHIVAGALVDASHRLGKFTLAGEPDGEIPLPDLGTVAGLSGKTGDPNLYFGLTSFTRPLEVHYHHLDTQDGYLLTAPEVAGLDPEEFVTTQTFVTSTDGTLMPVFLTHRRDVEPDGQVPTLLWGYGGFGISVTPMFRAEWQVWIERGGLLAVPTLRGGGEYGREWHDAGREDRKQQVFDDCLSAAEWLVTSGWTTPARLGLSGRSNGGLLAGACLTQRPEAFGAVVPEVGVLDMLRFHKFTIGWAWATDYGSAEEPAGFEWLYAYSPLHRIEQGRAYPATLVTTGDHDDRVVPGHSFKFTAALQAAQGGDAPILIRVTTDAGHGLGKPVSVLIDERADVIAFLTRALGIDT